MRNAPKYFSLLSHIPFSALTVAAHTFQPKPKSPRPPPPTCPPVCLRRRLPQPRRHPLSHRRPAISPSRAGRPATRSAVLLHNHAAAEEESGSELLPYNSRSCGPETLDRELRIRKQEEAQLRIRPPRARLWWDVAMEGPPTAATCSSSCTATLAFRCSRTRVKWQEVASRRCSHDRLRSRHGRLILILWKLISIW